MMAEDGSDPSGSNLRTTFKQVSSFEPLYTGGASTSISSNGKFLFAPVNDAVHITSVKSGKTIAKIPSDLEEITCLCLTPDQTCLIVASRSLSLRIFSLKFIVEDEGEESITWSLQRNIAKTHDAPVVVMKVDPTSTLIATGSSDTCAKVWDIRGGFCTHVFRGHGGIVSSLAWNMPPTSSSTRQIQLFTASIDGRVRVWDLHAGGSKPVGVLESHFSVVRGIAVSKDGTKVVTAGRDRMITLWEQSSRKNQKSSWQSIEVVTCGESLESAGFLPDDDTFWTAGAEGEIRFWSFKRRGVIKLQPGGRFARGQANKRAPVRSADDDEDEEGTEEDETRAITEVHLLSDINTIVSVHADQDFIFRSCSTLERTRQLAGFNDQIIDSALLSPLRSIDQKAKSDTHLAVATNSTHIRIYTLGAEEHTVDILPADPGSDEGHSGLILCLDKTSDGKWLASGGKDRTIRIWGWVPQAQSSITSNGAKEDEEIGEVVQLNSSSNDSASDGEKYGWSCIAIAQGHTESVGAIAFARRPTPTCSAPFLVTGSQDRTAKIWDLSKLNDHVEQDFRSNSSSRTPLKLTSLTTLKIHDKDINALDVSPNNALLLSGSQDKTAKVFAIQYQAPSKANSHVAAASLKLVKTCNGHKRGVWSVAFSPSDAVFLTGSSDRTMKLWSINDGFTCVKNYVGHTNSVLRVRFLRGSNGLQCLSCASDGLVKVWNVRTEECLDTLDGHEERVWGLDCTQSGEIIISGGADGMLRFWQDWTQQQESEALQKRQEDVEREQEFGNLLQSRDYTNAVALALSMQQPRRLFELFKTVDQQRSQGDDGSNATASMLSDAIRSNSSAVNSLRDPALAEVLARAGVLPSAAVPTSQPNQDATNSTSITGLVAVDEVIAKLSSLQLATLLTFVRDWNTTVRTANVAQTVLHAILRFHPADKIIEAFEQQPSVANGTQSINGGKKVADLGNVLDALLPYTRRHYDRAQRILTESAMLEYTLANMDTVLGFDGEEEEEEQEQNKILNGNGDIEMQSVESSSDEEEESDED